MGNDGNVGARVGGRVGDTSVWVDVERRKSSNIAAAFDEALRLQSGFAFIGRRARYK